MIRLDAKIKGNNTLKPLVSKRSTLRKNEGYTLAKPLKRMESPKKIKHFFIGFKTIIMIALILLIALAFILFFVDKKPHLNFVDRSTSGYVSGKLYLDSNFIGITNGTGFGDVPSNYCEGTHTLILYSEQGPFEWQTYPIDCKSENVFFYVEHKQKEMPKTIIFRFVDKVNNPVSGKLYFDNVFFADIKEKVSLTREQCSAISRIKIAYGTNYSAESENNKALCSTIDVVDFRIS